MGGGRSKPKQPDPVKVPRIQGMDEHGLLTVAFTGRSGLDLARSGSRVIVSGVAGSAAEQGIVDGDEVMAINGQWMPNGVALRNVRDGSTLPDYGEGPLPMEFGAVCEELSSVEGRGRYFEVQIMPAQPRRSSQEDARKEKQNGKKGEAAAEAKVAGQAPSAAVTAANAAAATPAAASGGDRRTKKRISFSVPDPADSYAAARLGAVVAGDTIGEEAEKSPIASRRRTPFPKKKKKPSAGEGGEGGGVQFDVDDGVGASASKIDRRKTPFPVKGQTYDEDEGEEEGGGGVSFNVDDSAGSGGRKIDRRKTPFPVKGQTYDEDEGEEEGGGGVSFNVDDSAGSGGRKIDRRKTPFPVKGQTYDEDEGEEEGGDDDEGATASRMRLSIEGNAGQAEFDVRNGLGSAPGSAPITPDPRLKRMGATPHNSFVISRKSKTDSNGQNNTDELAAELQASLSATAAEC